MTSDTTSGRGLSRRTFLAQAAGGAALAAVGPSLLRMGTAAAAPVPAAQDAPSGTLTFMTWDTPAVMQPVVAAFNKQYPGVNVEMSYTPPVPQYISTLQERLLAGTAADVFIYTAENKAQLNQGNFVRNLADQPWVKYMATNNRQFHVHARRRVGPVPRVLGGRRYLQQAAPSQSRAQGLARHLGGFP